MDDATCDLSMDLLSSTAASVIGTQRIGVFEAGPVVIEDDLSFTRLAIHTGTGGLSLIKTICLGPAHPHARNAVGSSGAKEDAAIATAVKSTPAPPPPEDDEDGDVDDDGRADAFTSEASMAWLASKEFLQHISAVKRMRHPHILQWTDVLQSPSSMHFAMPFAPGGPLMNALRARYYTFRKLRGERPMEPSSSTYFNDNRMHEDEARFYFQQLIAAVRHAHVRCDMAHGDIHFHNLWLDGALPCDVASTTIDKRSYHLRPKLKLANFGIAAVRAHSRRAGAAFAPATLAGIVEGSGSTGKGLDVLEDIVMRLACAAPELLVPVEETAAATSGGGHIRSSVVPISDSDLKQCDIWSCGVILYTLVSGMPPFHLRQQPHHSNNTDDTDHSESALQGNSSTSGFDPAASLRGSTTAAAAGEFDFTNIASTTGSLEQHLALMVERINAGHFSFPSYLSRGVRGVRHLIGSMLVPDARKRISLEQIIAHPWFDVRLERSILGTKEGLLSNESMLL